MAITFKSMRDIRKKRDFSLIELSELTNLSPGYIADLERGDKNNPSMATMAKLSQALHVEINELIDKEDQQSG